METLSSYSDFGTPKRRRILYGVIGFISALYVGRLVQLQIIEGEEYRSKSELQAIKQIVKEPVRGGIYDRNGTLIVHNTPSQAITVTPAEFDVRTLPFLATILGIDEDELRTKIDRYRKTSPTIPVKIYRDADARIVAAVEENRNELPGIAVLSESKRVYDFKGNSPHLFGYTKEIAEQQLAQLGDYYRPGDVIGYSGIEAGYENFMRGRKGIEFAAVNVLGQRVSSFNNGKNDVNPEDGFNLKLGIDARLQDFIDSLIDRRGAAVVIEPKTGEILALVSKPDYDLRKFSGRTPKVIYDSIANDPETPMFNRATQTSYPPGSTWKMLMALAGLQEGIVDENTTLQCNGVFTLGNKSFKCHGGVHGAINVRRAIQVSCNSYFYQLGLKLGVKRFEQYGKMFGFGAKTSADVIDEGSGLLPSAQYMNRRYGKNGWTEGVLVNWGIGQGEVGVTPLQMASYAATLANRGLWNQPHIVRSLIDKQQGSEQELAFASNQLPIKPEYFDIIHDGMQAVVGRGGTASGAAVDGVVVCGKTGTAQNSQNKDHAWFICFAPRENPQIAMCVMIENAGATGGTIAAPIAQKIMERYFALQKIDREKTTKPNNTDSTKVTKDIAQAK
ncbi:MAG: penicillin-binding protein 2 [Candidatus Kapabacteria bacterium]|jgi:penicillin-binding protein 2|nr:penicillin-binding protein 2 [Candidatus Kapabacteria bacterium]